MVNTKRLRCLIGWLGLLLPWIVVLLGQQIPESIAFEGHIIPDSISITYYTFACGPVFMIVLGSACMLLVSYMGYEKIDSVVNTLAGIFGMIICLFPCNYGEDTSVIVGTFQLPMSTSMILHYIGAAGFFALLSINSLFLFTKHGDQPLTEKKKARNVIYRVCGIGMILSFTLFLIPSFWGKIWIIEAIALFFFGISFLTKANYYKWLFAEKE